MARIRLSRTENTDDGLKFVALTHINHRGERVRDKYSDMTVEIEPDEFVTAVANTIYQDEEMFASLIRAVLKKSATSEKCVLMGLREANKAGSTVCSGMYKTLFRAAYEATKELSGDDSDN